MTTGQCKILHFIKIKLKNNWIPPNNNKKNIIGYQEEREREREGEGERYWREGENEEGRGREISDGGILPKSTLFPHDKTARDVVLLL